MSENRRHRAAPGQPEDSDVLVQDPDLPPVALDPETAEAEDRHWTPLKIAVWSGIALLGGVSWYMLALVRGETVNAIWFVFAAVCTYFIAYRFYSKFIERKLLQPNDRRATPAEYKADGKDYAATDRRVRTRISISAVASNGSEMQTGVENPGASMGFEIFEGTETETMVASMMIMATPRLMATSPHQR